MQKKLLILNTITSLLFQITTIICGFIVPRLILSHYGSETNGLVNSITQYLGIITFLEFGVGAVVQSSLYKPLADKDDNGISRIVVSAAKFFKKLAIILLLYIGVIIVFYPLMVKSRFTWMYTAGLIVAISISSFAQYYFGVVDRLLLTAAQRGYIQYTAQIITLVINTIACVILIEMDASIHLVKLTTSIIFLARPIYLRWYANRMFRLNRNIVYEGEPIKQKWNGAAQHFAAIVLDGSAMIILTVFSTLTDVSVFSVYWLVVMGVKYSVLAVSSGVQSLFGELWAKQDLAELRKTFGWIEWFYHNAAVFLFGCTAVLIAPFVSVYTCGVDDANYWQPVFGAMLALAHMGQCIRMPYNMMILAAGKYKETQSNYIVATVTNLGLACILVPKFGLIGVTIGTMCALYYQAVWMANYLSQNLVNWPIRRFWKQIAVDLIVLLIAGAVSCFVDIGVTSYYTWVLVSLKISAIWLVVAFIANKVFYNDNVNKLLLKITQKL